MPAKALEEVLVGLAPGADFLAFFWKICGNQIKFTTNDPAPLFEQREKSATIFLNQKLFPIMPFRFFKNIFFGDCRLPLSKTENSGLIEVLGVSAEI